MPAIDRWTTYMLAGDFERAWQESDRIEGALVWNREDFTDRTVLLRNEHGLGDTVQFIRYAPMLKRRCRRLIAKARPILVPFLKLFDCIDEVIASGDADPEFDVAMECTELPYVFRTTLHTIPCEVPYVPLGPIKLPL